MTQIFRTQTTSVNEQMQQKLYQNGQYSGSSAYGIDPKSTALSMAIARLHYQDRQGKFQSMKIGGILCLVTDRRLHSKYLRLYDLNSNKLLFQAELYINFHQQYKELNDYFHCFPVEKLTIGIEFSNVHDASTFKNLIQQCSPKGDNIEDIIKEEQRKIGASNVEITKPRSFERKEHAGWDPISQTFVLNAVPKEIKLLLKKAGFKKKDLKSKETALAIYEILLKEIDLDSQNKTGNSAMTRSGSISSSNYQFKATTIGERTSKRIVANSPEESRALSHMQMYNAQMTQHLSSGTQREPSEGNGRIQSSPVMNHLAGYMQNKIRTQSIIKPQLMSSPDKFISPQQHTDEFKIAKPPMPPPLMAGIPPPPLGMPPPPMGMPPPPMQIPLGVPPPIMMKLPPPPQAQNNNLSFSEQLKLQSQNLKKVQESQLTKVKPLSESQQMKITMNLAVVLEQRKKALQNDNADKNNSDVDSDDDNNDSDDSVW